MMDATMESVSRLYAQGHSLREIERRKICSAQKARKILITTGQYTSPLIRDIQEMYKSGMSIAEIAAAKKVTAKTVSTMLPYEKGIYNAEYPSSNAIQIRKSRKKNNAGGQST